MPAHCEVGQFAPAQKECGIVDYDYASDAADGGLRKCRPDVIGLEDRLGQQFDRNRFCRQLDFLPVFGPFEPMMHSPEVMSIARSTGDYLRYHSAIGNTLSELVILVTAREWSQDFEWYVHQPIAVKAGISKDITDAIADGRRPVAMSADEEIVYDFTVELQKNKRVSDATFNRAEQRFGKKGVVDMVGISGYYTSLAMQLNTARYQFSGEGPRLSRFPN
jgi:4-carboxymuconolactone decarboxylase